MGITDQRLVAEKVAIWEGTWEAEQKGDGINVSILYSFPSGCCSGIVASWNGGLIAIQYYAGILLDAVSGADQ